MQDSKNLVRPILRDPRAEPRNVEIGGSQRVGKAAWKVSCFDTKVAKPLKARENIEIHGYITPTERSKSAFFSEFQAEKMVGLQAAATNLGFKVSFFYSTLWWTDVRMTHGAFHRTRMVRQFSGLVLKNRVNYCFAVRRNTQLKIAGVPWTKSNQKIGNIS